MGLIQTVIDSNLTFTLFCILLILYTFKLLKNYAGIPPGPWGLPIFGYMFFLGKKPHEIFQKMSKKYGDVMSIKIGARLIIVLNDYEVIKEAFIKDGDIYAGKPKEGIEAMFGDYKSIFVTEGKTWKEQRRFLLSTMRDFGLGKTQLEEHLCREVENTIQELSKRKGQVTDISSLTKLLTTNSMAYFLFGHRFSDKGDDYIKALNELMEVGAEQNFTSLTESFPILEYLMLKLSKLGFFSVVQTKLAVDSHANKFMEEHEKTFDENNIRDVTDAYIEKNRSLMKKGETSLFSNEYLRPNILLLFTAGTETITLTLSWGLKLLAEFPDFQKRVQNEIDDVIGRSRPPTMPDRINMPFTEATILEIHRYISLVPLTFCHRITDDTKLRGYTIPKNSFVLANLWSVHHNPEIWNEPNKFNPERFLDENGKISNLREKVVAFSIGKRNCLGEPLARMEIFLFLTSFLQKFSFKPPKGENWNLQADIVFPLTKLNSFNVCVIERD